MFALQATRELTTFVGASGWSFLGSVSFEPRWSGFAELALRSVAPPLRTHILYPIDTGSAHQAECTKAQEAFWTSSFVRKNWQARRVDVELLGSAPWRLVRDATQDLVSSAGTRRLVIDVTTMPRVCMFPAVDWALRSQDIDDLAIVYTQPDIYDSFPLHSEPTGATVIPPFDHLPAVEGSRLQASWIPILGFGPTFAKSIYETIAGEYDLGSSIYPMLGFPAFDPSFFERCIADSATVFDGSGVTHDQFIYASAADPFETRDQIMRLMESTPPNHIWIGSPMGPKPMSVGMLLAAVDCKLTIMIAQARTYNPKYSVGIGPIHIYVLRQDGRKTY